METDRISTRIIDTTKLDEEELAGAIQESANCLASGGLVAFPTETVYGLGADALNREAAAKIYAAKGRPSDNPLIVHIADISDMEKLAYVNDKAMMLAHAFWPGPLTIILPKRDIVPDETTGGLDTVAIRMPAHPVALSLIRQSGVFVAAPSANLSGRPSPTKASHVTSDMNGRVDYIIDGGSVGIGIESTIVAVTGQVPVILRPGFITKQMLEDIIGEVLMDPALEEVSGDVRPLAPGMKYTHYAPKGELTLVEVESNKKVALKIRELASEKRKLGHKVGIMAPEESMPLYKDSADVVICVGKRSEEGTVAAGLYAALRDFDDADVEYIYAESFRGEGLSYAIMNRLLKAAGHRIIKV